MQIDNRNSDQIRESLLKTAPFFQPGLDTALSAGYGKALAYIFSEMMELVVKRLNKAPVNHFLAYLDVLGIKLLPPQPSVAPVVFYLSTGAPAEGVEIPARTSVIAGDIHFETDRMIWAIPQEIVAGYVYNTSKNQIFAIPEGVYKGIPIQPAYCQLSADCNQQTNDLFVTSGSDLKKGDQIIIDPEGATEYATIVDIKDNVFQLARKLKRNFLSGTTVARNDQQSFSKGDTAQKHCLYIGHKALFNIETASDLYLLGNASFPLTPLSYAEYIWEYWTGDESSPADWVKFSNVSSNGNNLVLHKSAGEIKKSKINGIESRWIRCRCTTNQFTEMPLKIKIAPQSKTSAIDFDAVLYNSNLLNVTTAPILPFGSRPRQYDAFYLASKEGFSKPGVIISVVFEKSGTDSTDQNPLIVWEYWNGINWTSLTVGGLRINGETEDFNLIDGYDSTTKKRTVTFTCPSDMVETEVAGKVNRWIRLRIVVDYGSETKVVNNKWESSIIIAPKLASIKLFWQNGSEQLPEFCISENNLTLKNLTELVRQEKPVTAFEHFTKASSHHSIVQLFFGFNGKPENGPVSLYFQLSDDLPLSRSLDCQVKWYISLEDSSWKLIDIVDLTHNLTRSGVIEFLFPSEFASLLLFGQKRYWVLASYENPIASDMPSIKAVYVNAVMTTQAESITDEILGGSNTDPDQTYYLLRSPVTDCELWVDEINSISEEEKADLTEEGFAVQEEPGRFGINGRYWVKWIRVDDFLESTAGSRHFTLDLTNGEIRFGNGVHGMIPPPGKDNVKADYTVGGGKQGNVAAGAINTLKSSIRFIDRLTNPIKGQAGADAETIDEVIQRGPQLINHRNRVVSLHDFEQLAAQASADIKRTKGYISGREVHIIVVPDSLDEQPVISQPEREKIEVYLTERCLNTVLPHEIVIDNPKYIPIDTSIKVIPVSMDKAVSAKNAVMEQLKSFFHPLKGGTQGAGWEFGRTVRISDVYALLGKVNGVDHVTDLKLARSGDTLDDKDVQIDPYSLVCPGTHLITVTMKG